MPLRPSWRDILYRAFLANGDLESVYFNSKGALIQVNQAAAWPNSRIALSYSYMFSRENMKAWDCMTISAGFDPSMNLRLPIKVEAAGRVAFEAAREAGERFRVAKFDLQKRVLYAYLDLALAAERARIERDNVNLLKQLSASAAARAQAGAPLQDLLKVETDSELAKNNLRNLEAEVRATRSVLNGLLARDPNAPLEVAGLPPPRSVIRNDARLIEIAVEGRDMGIYLDDARKAVAEMVKLPAGYRLEWSGSFEGMQGAGQMLKYVIPITLFLIAVLLYLNARSLPKVLIVMAAVPFSLVGAFLLLWALGYNLSVAVWVGIIALAGVDAETGMVMLLYLDVSYERWKRENRMNSLADLEASVMEGAVQRVRPKMMTVLAILMGLLPIMWGGGAGSDVMKRIAAPMVGGVVTSFILELMIYPAIYVLWKWWAEVRRAAVRAPERV